MCMHLKRIREGALNCRICANYWLHYAVQWLAVILIALLDQYAHLYVVQSMSKASLVETTHQPDQLHTSCAALAQICA